METFVRAHYRAGSGTAAEISEGNLLVTLPAGRSFVTNISKLDFGTIETELDVSGQLYLYAGQFLTVLPQDHPETAGIVSAFFKWMNSPRFKDIDREYESWDHATAMRIETAQYLRTLRAANWTEEAENLLLKDIEWAMQPANVKLNNHGVFLLIALLFTAKVGIPEGSSYSRSDLIDHAADMLMQIVDYVYNSDGWCAENSPQYDRVWLFLLQRVNNSFADLLEQTSIIERFTSILNSAAGVIRAQVYHDGYLVPRGDTQRLKTEDQPVFGTNYSTRVGIWTYSSPETYMMATAGHASITHKHVDDTQLLYSFKSTEFFIDGGFHGHIYTDPRVPALKSPIGHSVLTARQFDQLPPWLAYRGDNPPLRARMLHADERSTILRKDLRNYGVLSRMIDISGDDISVVDSWSLKETENPVSRFLLPSSCFIDWDSTSVYLTRNGKQVTMRFDKNIEVDVITGEAQEPFRGWLSESAAQMQAAHCLEIKSSDPINVGSLSYTINAHDLDSSEWSDFKQEQRGRHGGPVVRQGSRAALWKVDEFCTSEDIARADMVEIAYDVVGDVASNKAGVLEIAFYDKQDNRLAITAWSHISPKFGEYRYIPVGDLGVANDTFSVTVPPNARYLVLKGHSWLDYESLYFTNPPTIKLN